MGEEGYIVRSHGNYSMTRSVSTELELDAGTYLVLMKVTAKRYQGRYTVEDVIRMNCKHRQEKLLQIGLSYDLGHAKGIITETEEERQAKAEQEAKVEATAKARARGEAKQRKYQDWVRDKKRVERNRRQKRRIEEHRKKKAAQEEEARKKGEAADVINETGGQFGPKDKPQSEEKARTQNDLGNNESPGGDAQPKAPDSEATPVVDPATSDAGDGLMTPPPTEKDHDGTPSSDAAAGNKVSEDAPPMPTSGEVPGNEPTIVAKQANLESIQAQSDKDLSTQEKIDKFNSDPVLNPPVPAVQVNGEDVPGAEADLVPPPCPGLLNPPADGEDEETVITYASSIDTDLDEPYFRSGDESEMDGEEDEMEDEDLADYSDDPWNAVCVVGLRLYTREGDVSVEVARPLVGDSEEEAPLDLDDPSKGMSDEPLSPSAIGQSVSMVEKMEDVIKAAESEANGSS